MFPRRRATSAANAYSDSDSDSESSSAETLWPLTLKHGGVVMHFLGSDSTTVQTVRGMAESFFKTQPGFLKYTKMVLADNLTLAQLHTRYLDHPLTLVLIATFT